MRYAVIVFLVIFGMVALACNNSSGEEARREAVESRNETFDRAEAVAPAAIPVNFSTRQALVEFTVRQDQLDHPWYVYILGDPGNIIGYYVAQTRPVNSCNFLSSTEDVRTSTNGNLVLTAPSLDGIFYGGSGASAGCDAWFFFDVATDAMIEIRGVKFFSSDQPLRLEADPILVAPGQ